MAGALASQIAVDLTTSVKTMLRLPVGGASDAGPVESWSGEPLDADGTAVSPLVAFTVAAMGATGGQAILAVLENRRGTPLRRSFLMCVDD